MPTPHITVYIVTKNRPELLKACLDSLAQQTLAPQHIYILDNAPKFQNLSKHLPPYPQLHYVSLGSSVPAARNYALDTCLSPYLAFIDDDCRADQNWLASGSKTLLQNPTVAFVIGVSKLQNPHHSVALAAYCHHAYWFHQKLKLNHNHPDPQNFDTKNILLNLSLIPPTLRFNSNWHSHGIDSSDTDFGFQLYHHQRTGLFSPHMIVSHLEEESLSHFLKKSYQKGRLAYRTFKRWELSGELIDPVNAHWLSFFRSWRHLNQDWKRYLPFSPSPKLFQNILALLVLKLSQRAFTQGFCDAQQSAAIALHTV
jgi:glycosyltransferase involved in cell wall biosynthesis